MNLLGKKIKFSKANQSKVAKKIDAKASETGIFYQFSSAKARISTDFIRWLLYLANLFLASKEKKIVTPLQKLYLKRKL